MQTVRMNVGLLQSAAVTPIFNPSPRRLPNHVYEPCTPSSSCSRVIVTAVQAPSKSSGGDWSSRLLSMSGKNKKKKDKTEDVYQPQKQAVPDFPGFDKDEDEEEEDGGPTGKRLPAEMR